MISIPYVYAAYTAGPDHVFAGFLFNPQDANSYLAKMYQGWRGEWLVKLPYTAVPGEGAYLFLFYLFLGHVARWLSLPLIWVFHLARLLAALALFMALEFLWRSLLPEDRRPGVLTPLVLFGSGVGWLVFLTGVLTSDFLVPEAYPFLSSFANPHFPLGLALTVWLLVVSTDRRFISTPGQSFRMRTAIPRLLAAFLLSAIMPFGVVVLVVVLGGLFVWRLSEGFIQRRQGGDKIAVDKPLLLALFLVSLGAAPLMIYDQAIVRLDPVFAGWNAQNLTPSPPVWDIFIAFSPALLAAALLGSARLRGGRDLETPLLRPLLVWVVLGLVLLYVPFGLQRRFMFGLFVPIAGLAGVWLVVIETRRPAGLFARALLFLSLPSNLILMMVVLFGVQSHDPLFYLTRDEHQALNWIEAHTAPQALVLSSPEMGMFIPARTGRRVLYGHPFETVNASQMADETERFYTSLSEAPALDLLESYQVDYVFFGPRERALGALPNLPQLKLVFTAGEVTVYRVE